MKLATLLIFFFSFNCFCQINSTKKYDANNDIESMLEVSSFTFKLNFHTRTIRAMTICGVEKLNNLFRLIVSANLESAPLGGRLLDIKDILIDPSRMDEGPYRRHTLHLIPETWFTLFPC